LLRKDRNDFVFNAMTHFPVMLVREDRNGEWGRIVKQSGVRIDIIVGTEKAFA
jgi:hypothetical protein